MKNRYKILTQNPIKRIDDVNERISKAIVDITNNKSETTNLVSNITEQLGWTKGNPLNAQLEGVVSKRCAMSGDGKTVVYKDTATNDLLVYSNIPGRSAKISTGDMPGEWLLGGSDIRQIELSDDGSVIVAGDARGFIYNTSGVQAGAGRVLVYRFENGVWVNRLKAIGATDKGMFTPIVLGHSISCNQDGTVIAAMAGNYSQVSGLTASEAVKLWRWDLTSSEYVEDTSLTAPGKLSVVWSNFGSIALTQDGSVVIVAERGGGKLHRIDYVDSAWGPPTVITYATAFPGMASTPRGDIGRLPTVVSNKDGFVLGLTGTTLDNDGSLNTAVVFKFPDTYTSGALVSVEIPMSDGYWCDMSKTSDYVVLGRGELNSQRGQVAVYKLTVRETSITSNPVNIVSGINNTDAVGGSDNIGAGVAISNDGKHFAFQCDNALSKLAGIYRVGMNDIDALRSEVLEIDNKINLENLKLESVKQNVPPNLEPLFVEPTWNEKPEYTLSTLTQGQYPLFGLDNNYSDALVLPYTNGISNDWDITYTNTTIDKQIVKNIANSLKYTGSGSVNEHSLVTAKEYTIKDGFNFSCKVTLDDSDGNRAVLGYNVVFDASGSGIDTYFNLNASGTTEVELVMVKDQDSSNVRVWVDGVEDNTTVFPDFDGGRLVVLANPNATFSDVKLTDTKVELPDFDKNTRDNEVAYLQEVTTTTPIDDQRVKVLKATIKATQFWSSDDTQPYYLYKKGASVYYRTGYGAFDMFAEYPKYLANITETSAVDYGVDIFRWYGLSGGTTNKSFKVYARDITSVQTKSTTAPLIPFDQLSSQSQQSWIQGKMMWAGLSYSDAQAASVTEYNNMTMESFVTGVAQISSGIDYEDTHQTMVWSNELTTGKYSTRDLWFLNRLNVPEEQEYVVSDDNNSYVNNVYLPITTISEIQDAAVKILTGEKLTTGKSTGLWPIPNSTWSSTDPLIVYSPDTTTTETNFSDAGSFPTRAEWDAKGLSSFYAPYVTALGGDAAAETTFDALDFKQFIEQFLFNNSNTVKFEALPQ